MRARLKAGGYGWGDLKKQLFEVLNAELAPLREKYGVLMEPGSELDTLLAQGAEKARQRASRMLKSVRGAMGIAG